MNDNEDLIAKQIQREDVSESEGYKKLERNEQYNKQISNASSNQSGIHVIKNRHESIVRHIESLAKKHLGSKVKQIQSALTHCYAIDPSGCAHDLVNIEVWAFIGLQTVLDNVFNPNVLDGKVMGRSGGDKKVAAKKDLSSLELHVGKLINDQMALQLIKEVFPAWFRYADSKAKHRHDGDVRSSPGYWNSRMTRSINKKIERLEKDGDFVGAEFLKTRKKWTTDDCRVIG